MRLTISKKGILLEKYKLNEADEDTAQETKNDAGATLKSFQDALDKILAYDRAQYNAVKKQTNPMLQTLLDNSNTLVNQVQNIMAEKTDLPYWINVAKEFIETYNKLAEKVSGLNDKSLNGQLANSYPNVKSLQDMLKQIERGVKAAEIQGVITYFKNFFKDIKAKKAEQAKLDELIKKKEDDIANDKANKEIIDKLAQVDKQAKKLETIIEKYNKQVESNSNTVFSAQVSELVDRSKTPPKNLQELSELLSLMQNLETTLMNIINQRETSATVDALTAKEDWKAEFLEVTGMKEATANLWEDYFKKEWPGNEQFMSSLGSTFRNDLLKLGFNGTDNPFVYYFKLFLKKFESKEIPVEMVRNGFNIYNVIHNAYIDGDITKKDLTMAADTIKEINIIFSADFWTKSQTDAIKYLILQAQVFRHKTDLDNATQFIKARYANDGRLNVGEFIQDAFYEPGNLFYELSRKAGDINNKLKSVNTVDTDINKALNFEDAPVLADFDEKKLAVDKNAVQFFKNNLETIIKALGNKFINKADALRKFLADYKITDNTFDMLEAKTVLENKYLAEYDIHNGNFRNVINKIINMVEGKTTQDSATNTTTASTTTSSTTA